MALLHYHNLTDHRPDLLMRQTFGGLKNFYSFLTRTRNYLESDASVKRLAWRSVERKGSKKEYGYWVQLIEPEGRLNEPESTFRDFLDENNSEIYESLSIDDSSSRVSFSDGLKIKVLDRDFDAEQLLLERKPLHPDLVLRPNTWPIVCQLRALQHLQDAPSQAHRPLLRLFEASDHADWPELLGDYETAFYDYSSEAERAGTGNWYVLTDEDRPGTSEQRKFVEIAINTPDFAFLEGPPGSGKTTAICELILQLATQGKRVLLCASTHVAVDNVLERLMDENNVYQDQVIPVRIGDKSNVSEKAKKWQLKNFVKTEKDRLLHALHECKARTLSQEELLNQLRAGNDEIQRIVLDCANLVCGTTIGILQHPDIKIKGSSNPQFDVLIIDEASKTTFQEFLVPALLAKRWVLVGDPKQLSPYVDEDSMAVNIEPCLPDPTQRNACVDIFLASQPGNKQRRTSVVVSDSKETFNKYRAQADAHKVDIANAEMADKKLSYAAITVGNIKSLTKKFDELPLDITHIRAKHDDLLQLRRRVASYRKSVGQTNEELPQWEKEVGWRLTRRYDLRLNTLSNEDKSSRRSSSERLHLQLESLLPTQNTEDVRRNIDGVRRVALPSVLESLRYGFERNERQRTGSALSDGFPEEMLEERHVLLSTQHRMHADIAEFPHNSIYNGEALFTPDFLNAKRAWSYSGFKHRAVWFNVDSNANNRSNSNNSEAKKIIEQLQKFDRWAEENPRDDGGPWEAAILTFYRGQEKEIRKLLRKWSGDHKSVRYFNRGRYARPYLSIQVCTVDRFQGHEADLVMLSFTKSHPTSFLESPNRLNVAITRARYQLVVFGDRNAMQTASGVLGRFASQSYWVKEL